MFHSPLPTNWVSSGRTRVSIRTHSLIALVFLAMAVPAFATTLFVATTGSDSGNCSSQASPCKTIGFAITQSSSGDTINVAPGTYAEHVIVSKNVTIQGSLSGTTTVDGSGSGKGISINSGVTATLSNLTITNSLAGGILNNGMLMVTNSTISGNLGSGQGAGGGITNFGTLTVTNSTISGNVSGFGGGILNDGALTITNSTISGNSASLGAGGGILNDNTLKITNSTISGNSGPGAGGIYNTGFTVGLINTILSSNGGNCGGSFASGGHNLSDDATCNFAGTGDMNKTDPKLGPLQSNGGPTQTMALLVGSPAIDAGDDAVTGPPLSLATDQRGPGFPRRSKFHVDIGAYEVQFPPVTRYVATTGLDTIPGPIDNDCSLLAIPCLTIQHAVNEAFSGDTINVAAGTYAEQVTVSQNVTIQGSTSGTTTVDGSGGAGIQINSFVTATLRNLMITKSTTSGIVNSGTLTVISSTISGNSANFGGGILNFGTLTVTNSTISGNIASTNGGGISTISILAALTVVNTTISGNTAGNAGAGIETGGTLTVTNTILSNPNGGDCADASIISGGHNLSSDTSCNFSGTGNMINTDPKLGPLANNGGPTLTMALLAGSPAIDAGDDAVLGPPLSLATDQRGPGFPRQCGQHVDIGAFEFGDPDCTATMLSVDVNPAIAGQTVTFTATVTKLVNTVTTTPTGTVTFKDGPTTLGTGTLDSNVIAAFSTSSLSVGGHAITATYGGDSAFKGSVSGSLNEVVNQASSATALSSSANPSPFGTSVTFTATVSDASAGSSGTPTGIVTFKDGGSMLGTGTLDGSGMATFSTSSLAIGQHSIAAVYGGDSSFVGSKSAALNETVNPSNITITASPSSISLVSGTSGTVTLTITGNGPFPLLVHCIGNMVSCSVTTPVPGQNSSTATLTIDSSGKLARSSPDGPWVGRSAAIFLGMMTPLAVLLMGRERKRGRRSRRKALSAVMLGLLLVGASALSSCGGGQTPVGGVARGTYFVNVVATSAGVTGTTAVTITVR